jgi:hypothetical protein
VSIATPINRLKAALPSSVRGGATRAYDVAVSSLSRATHRHQPIERTAVVLGTGRSGTTLLQEIVAASEATYPIFEPMSPYEDPRVAALGALGGFVVRSPEQDDPRLRALLDEILRGRHLTRWSTRLQGTRGLAGARRFVMKEVKLTRAVGWFTRAFPDNRVVVIVRHPCAVVPSMLHASGRWREWSPARVREMLGGGHEELAAELVDDNASPAVRLSAFWAAETSDVLSQTNPSTALVSTYEELLSEPTKTLTKVFDHLDVPAPADVEQLAQRASAMSTPSSAVRTGTDPLRSWTTRLSNADRDAILRVTRAFGLEFYTDDPMPDLDALHAQHATG